MALPSLPRATKAQTYPSHNEIRLDRLYRAFISGQSSRDGEQTIFIEALSCDGAIRKIAAVVSALEFGSKPEEVRERVYNCTGAAELIEEGTGADDAARLFQTGWSGSEAISWVEQPLFLVRAPAGLIRAWAAIPTGVQP